MTHFEQQVETYIIADRQWPRALRIAHAKMKLASYDRRYKQMPSPEYNHGIHFWMAVLERNEG